MSAHELNSPYREVCNCTEISSVSNHVGIYLSRMTPFCSKNLEGNVILLYDVASIHI